MQDEVQLVREHLARISDDTDRFAATSRLRCPEGCGACCRNPQVEASVAECLPLAWQAWAHGFAEELHAKAKAAQGQMCVVFSPDALDPQKGRCSRYDVRPAICRLFAFSAVRARKDRELAACRVHKNTQPHLVEEAQRRIDEGAFVPLMPDYTLSLMGALGCNDLTKLRPINEAMALAIERIGLRLSYSEKDDVAPCHGNTCHSNPTE